MSALPTREQIVEILQKALGWHVPTTSIDAAADALLARLRPAWERMELVIERVREHATKYDHHAYLELLAVAPVTHAWVKREEFDVTNAEIAYEIVDTWMRAKMKGRAALVQYIAAALDAKDADCLDSIRKSDEARARVTDHYRDRP